MAQMVECLPSKSEALVPHPPQLPQKRCQGLRGGEKEQEEYRIFRVVRLFCIILQCWI
jgi:hypothetical protein